MLCRDQAPYRPVVQAFQPADRGVQYAPHGLVGRRALPIGHHHKIGDDTRVFPGLDDVAEGVAEQTRLARESLVKAAPLESRGITSAPWKTGAFLPTVEGPPLARLPHKSANAGENLALGE